MNHYNGKNINLNFETSMSVQECIHNAMSAGMLVNMLYSSQQISFDQYIDALNEIRDTATSLVITNTIRQSVN
jgi:hypothetical protein